jgi:hypothetical protein
MWWLLSLYSPHESDAVDWSHGEYSVQVRGGWTDSVAGGVAKKQVRMITEGSVLSAASLRGHAVDVAPDGFPHPVYRSGLALAIPAPTEIVVRVVEASRVQRVVPEAVVSEEVVEIPIEEQPTVAPEEDAASVRVSREEPVAAEESVELPAVPEEDALTAPEPELVEPAVEEHATVSPTEDPATVPGPHDDAQPEAKPDEVSE